MLAREVKINIMFALTVMPKSAVASLLRISPPDILQQFRKLSLSSAHRIDSFIDKEFEKAETNLDTETLDDPSSLLKKLERDQRRRILAADRARMSRLFKPPKEPRTLSWDTIEQIRYLKQENGDEWSTQKLAASFGISRDLVVKVLKSKFVPTEKTRRKQNERVNFLAGYLPEKSPKKTKFTGTERALVSSFTKGQQQSKTQTTLSAASNQNPAEIQFVKKDTFSPQQSISDEKTVNKIALQEHSRAYSRKAPLQNNPRSKTFNQSDSLEEKNNAKIVDKYSPFDTGASRNKSFNATNNPRLKDRTEVELQESEVEEELNIDMEKPETYMDQRRRILAADRARMSRLFKPPKEPRTLSWDTIEQIRYLKQENGDEWSTQKLAASFGISRDLVVKVLKSKFVPTEKTRRKQNERVNFLAGYLPEKSPKKTKFTGTERALVSSFTKGQQQSKTQTTLSAASNQNPAEIQFVKKDTFSPQQSISDEKTVNKIALQEHSRAYSRKAPLQNNPRSKTFNQSDSLEEKNNAKIVDKYSPFDTGASRNKSFNATNNPRLKDRTEVELQESEVEEELNIDMEKPETYMYVTEGSGPPKIIQRGNEFFDENGEFLYRL